MTLSDYRNTLSWKGAIDLGPGLIRLAEEMPASEEMGLSFQLRQLMVELPAAIAADMGSATETRHAVMFKLAATLELIDRVYPALDSGATGKAVEKLAERLSGPNFAEGNGSASAAPAAEPATASESEPKAEPETPAAPAEATAPIAAPAAAEVPAVAEPAVTPAPAAEATHVAVQPASEDQSVQPSSSQQAQ